MKLIYSLVLILFIIPPSCIAQKNCNCRKGTELIYSLTEKRNTLLIACGYLIEEKDCVEKTVTGLLLKDCVTDSIIIDYSFDEISHFILSQDKNQINIFNTKYILVGNNWDYELVKESEQSFYNLNGEIKSTESTNVLEFPPLTQKQVEDLNKLCIYLKKQSTENSSIAIDEKSIYMLYMGFLNKHKDSEYLLQNFRKLFHADGAISETLSEVGF